MHEILLRTQVSFGCLDRCMAEEQLNLLKLAAGSPAHLRACPAEVVGGNARRSDRRRLLLE